MSFHFNITCRCLFNIIINCYNYKSTLFDLIVVSPFILYHYPLSSTFTLRLILILIVIIKCIYFQFIKFFYLCWQYVFTIQLFNYIINCSHFNYNHYIPLWNNISISIPSISSPKCVIWWSLNANENHSTIPLLI